MKEQDISFQELHLNIKQQNINMNEFTTLGYEFEEGKYVFLLMIPKKFIKNIKN